MKKPIALVIAVVSINCFAQDASSTDEEEVNAAITSLRDGLVASFKDGDVDGLLNHLDTNVVVTWQNAEVCRGHDEVKDFHHRMMTGEQAVVREIQSDPKVIGRQINGNWAVSWGQLNDHFMLNDGSDLPFNSVFTATIAKRGDRWLVTAFHASVNAFENPIIELAVKKVMLWVGAGAGLLGVVIGFLVGRRGRKA